MLVARSRIFEVNISSNTENDSMETVGIFVCLYMLHKLNKGEGLSGFWFTECIYLEKKTKTIFFKKDHEKHKSIFSWRARSNLHFI